VSALTVVAIGLLGGAGAVARFLLDAAVAAGAGRGLPAGTLAVNLSGTFLLGLLVGAAVEGDALRLAGLGFVGAYTTFSTWVYESHRLAEDGRLRAAAANFAVSLALGLAAVWIGRLLGGLL
jgi:CrcB protein